MSETRKRKIREINKELTFKIKNLLLVGNRIADIAKVLKLDRTTIYNIIHRANVPYSFDEKYNKRDWGHIESDIIKLSKKYSILSISKKFSISRDTVRRILKKNAAYTKKCNSQILLDEADIEKIFYLRNNGMTLKEISKIVNRSISSICKLLNGETKSYKKGGLK